MPYNKWQKSRERLWTAPPERPRTPPPTTEPPSVPCPGSSGVEQWIENPRVGGSIPPPGTIFAKLEQLLELRWLSTELISLDRAIHLQFSFLVRRASFRPDRAPSRRNLFFRLVFSCSFSFQKLNASNALNTSSIAASRRRDTHGRVLLGLISHPKEARLRCWCQCSILIS